MTVSITDEGEGQGGGGGTLQRFSVFLSPDPCKRN